MLIAIIRKDIKLLLRDKTGFFFTLIFPLLMAVLFGSVFGGQGQSGTIAIMVVDLDQSEESLRFVAQLEAAPELDVKLASNEDAVTAVREGRSNATVILPPGFGAEREKLVSGNSVQVEVAIDPSHRATAAMLSGILTGYILERPSGEAVDFPQPVHFSYSEIVADGQGPPNAFAISFPQGIVWGLMMCAMTFGMGLITERTQGTLMRLRVAPIRRTTILAGKGGACFLVLILMQVMLLALARVVFHVNFGGPVVVAMAVLSTSIAFVGIMMLLSVFGRTEKAANGYATSAMMLMMMFGGGMIPLFVMPGWMVSASNASPVKWAVIALEGSIWRGYSPTDMLFPCGVLLAVGFVSFAIGSSLFRD
ncbi:MAG: ABC transporter permease [Kofleriaceae bacterium]|nr:ABC transporter permease [Kofleriaceae bacterium]